MAWDFSTEPEFEQKLEWMRQFVREEVFPLEVLDTDEQTFKRIVRSLQDQVKSQGLWAAHLPPELGGLGFGQVKLGRMHEVDGMSPWAPLVFGNQAPDSGNSEVLALFGTPEQKERWLYPLLDGKIRSGFSMTEPMHAGSDPVNMSTTAVLEGDEWVINGHKWFTSNGLIADVLLVMAVTDPDEGRRARAVRPGPLGDQVRERPHPEGQPHRRPGAGVPDGAGPARPRPHPPLHAVAGPGEACVRHAVRALAAAGVVRRPAGVQAERPELDRGLGGRDAGGAPDDAVRGVDDRPARRGGGAEGDLADQVLRREGAARRDRPRQPRARRRGVLSRTA